MNYEYTRVVAAVRKQSGTYWSARRTSDGRHGGLVGLWEYPGGKVEPGETLEQAIRREMQEEFGVDIEVHRLIDTITSTRDDRLYEVAFFDVTFLSEPELRVHSEADWFTIDQLLEMPQLPSGSEFNRRLATYGKLAGAPKRLTSEDFVRELVENSAPPPGVRVSARSGMWVRACRGHYHITTGIGDLDYGPYPTEDDAWQALAGLEDQWEQERGFPVGSQGN